MCFVRVCAPYQSIVFIHPADRVRAKRRTAHASRQRISSDPSRCRPVRCTISSVRVCALNFVPVSSYSYASLVCPYALQSSEIVPVPSTLLVCDSVVFVISNFFFPIRFLLFEKYYKLNAISCSVKWTFYFFFFNLVVILCPHFRFSYLVPQIVLLYNSRVLVVYFYLRLRLSVWWSNGRLQFSCENRRARLQQRWLCQIVQWTLLATQRREQSSVPASTSDHRNCTNKTVSNQRYIFKIFFIPHRFCRNSVT